MILATALLVCATMPAAAAAQAGPVVITGTVVNREGVPVEGASVSIEGSEDAVFTDAAGRYRLAVSTAGSEVLVIGRLGYGEQRRPLELVPGALLAVDVVLDVGAVQAGGIVVRVATEAEEVRETGFSVAVVETTERRNLTADVNRILEATPGVHLREVGGLGSGFKLSLNGLSGNQIRYFVDGVPMENFGSSLTLNNYPVNLVRRLEVYKGAVPITLGADALGGAVNIVTDYRERSFLDVAYSHGSFDTRRASVNGQWADRERGVWVKGSSFFNHSDNDYWMESVPVHDLELGNLVDSVRTRRFNDAYTSFMVRGEAGIFDRPFADRLSLAVMAAGNRNEHQHPDNHVGRTFGGFHTTNRTLLASGTWSQRLDALELDAFLVVGRTDEAAVDTSRLRYNWAGEVVERAPDDPKGELFERRSHLELTDRLVRSNVGASYEVTDNHVVSLSGTQSYVERTGEDRVDELNLSFESPNFIHKNLLGAAWEYRTDDRSFDATVFGKQYWYAGRIVTRDYEDNEIVTEPSLRRTGYGAAVSWAGLPGIELKASYEKAYRIPESYEILGDGIYVFANPALGPETSHNVNLGTRWDASVAGLAVSGEVNTFYRLSRDFIRFNPLGPFGEYENLANVRTTGVEGGVRLNYRDFVQLDGNVTYQDLTDRTRFDEGLPNTNFGSRVPNVPYLFGNVRLALTPSPATATNRVRLYATVQSVRSFYLTWEALGDPDEKNVIPGHTTLDLEAEYEIMDGRLNLSATIRNVTDARVYDNFNIQKPGRAIHVKTRFFLE